MSLTRINKNKTGSPYCTHAVSITPDDNDWFNQGYMLYVGTGGDINVVPLGSENAVVFKNVQDGTFLPLIVLKVLNTNTTALNILGIL